MNTRGHASATCSTFSIAFMIACTSAPEPVDPTIALRASEHLATEQRAEESTPRVKMVESEHEAETVLSLDIECRPSRLHSKYEFALRKVEPVLSGHMSVIDCPTVSADGLTE